MKTFQTKNIFSHFFYIYNIQMPTVKELIKNLDFPSELTLNTISKSNTEKEIQSGGGSNRKKESIVKTINILPPNFMENN